MYMKHVLCATRSRARHSAILLLVALLVFSGRLAFPARAAENESLPYLNQTELTLAAGKSRTLAVNNSGGLAITWVSADPEVAAVTASGKVTAVGGGSTLVTAILGEQKLSCSVTVKELKMKTASLVMITDGSHKLKLSKKNITGKVTWKSSNKKIAVVSSSGKVTAKKKGTVTITAKADGCKTTCRIRIVKAQLSATELSLKKGKSQTLKVSGTSKKVTWKSSNPEVATVSSKGKIKAKKKGTARITAAIGSGKLTCKVTVTTTKWDDLLDTYQEDASTNQLLFVKYTGGSHAQVILYHKVGGKWKKVLSCDGEVGKYGINKQREGDKKTPTGTFHLTQGFGIQKNPGTKVPYVQVNQNLYWCGDRNYYNQLIDITQKPHSCTGEHLIDYTRCYAYGMFLDYNRECTIGKGSAIFLHCKGNSGYTAGCVAVSQENMIKILRTVEAGARICIYPA